MNKFRRAGLTVAGLLLFVSPVAFGFQAAPTFYLTSSINPGIAGQAITFVVKVTNANPMGMTAPTGTITFLNNGTTSLSTAPVTLSPIGTSNASQAILTTYNLTNGTYNVTAQYSGDSQNAAATSPVYQEVVAPAPTSSYTFTLNEYTETVEAGTPATFTVIISPIDGYNGTVSFECSNLPTATSCSFNPINVTPNSSGDEATATLTVNTTTSSSLFPPRLPGKNRWSPVWAGLIGAGVFGLVFVGGKKRHNAALRTLVAAMLICGWTACGGSSSTTTTPLGTQTFTVTATGTAGTNGGSTAAQSVTVTLTVTSTAPTTTTELQYPHLFADSL